MKLRDPLPAGGFAILLLLGVVLLIALAIYLAG